MSEVTVTSDYPKPPDYYLRYGPGGSPLAPPEPPTDGKFRLFGTSRQLDEQTPSLEDMGLKTLFDVNGNKKEELKKLVFKSKASFTELVRALSDDASHETVYEMVNELDTVMLNMLYLVNEMRTDQAEKELRVLLTEQIRAKKIALSLLIERTRKAREKVQTAFVNDIQEGNASNDIEMDEVRHSETEENPSAESIVDMEYKKLFQL